MARFLAITLAAGLLAAGCASGAAKLSSPSPSSALRVVKASTARDAARLKALLTDRGQPWGMPPVEVGWAHLGPGQLPRNLVPSVTLGRGLLLARAADQQLRVPTFPASAAVADLLFERGLYIHATTRNAFGQPVPDASSWAAHVAKELANGRHDQSSASLRGVPVLVGFGPSSIFGGGGTDTFVRWIAGGRSITVELEGRNVVGALAVARSLGS